MAPRANTSGPKGAAVPVSQKEEFLKNWWQSMAVGNCLQLSTGSGWDVLQWKGWARPAPRSAVPRLVLGAAGLSMPGTGHRAQRLHGSEGEGARGRVCAAVSCRSLSRRAHLCKLRLRAVSSKPCFRFAQTACSLPPFAAVTGWPLSYTWLRHVPDKGHLPIRRFASHGLAHPARHTPAPPRRGKHQGRHQRERSGGR